MNIVIDSSNQSQFTTPFRFTSKSRNGAPKPEIKQHFIYSNLGVFTPYITQPFGFYINETAVGITPVTRIGHSISLIDMNIKGYWFMDRIEIDTSFYYIQLDLLFDKYPATNVFSFTDVYAPSTGTDRVPTSFNLDYSTRFLLLARYFTSTPYVHSVVSSKTQYEECHAGFILSYTVPDIEHNPLIVQYADSTADSIKNSGILFTGCTDLVAGHLLNVVAYTTVKFIDC